MWKLKPSLHELETSFQPDGLHRNYDPILLRETSELTVSFWCLTPLCLIPPNHLPSPAPDQTPGEWWTEWTLHSVESTRPCLSTGTWFLAPSLSLAARLVSLPSPKHTHSWLTPSGQSSLEVAQAPGYGNANYNKHSLVTS